MDLKAIHEKLEQYIYIDKLGEGGFGRVYKVSDKLGGREFALKVLFKESYLEIFKREGKILESLSHKNIVQIYDSGFKEEGRGFILMQYMKHGNLKDYIMNHKNISIYKKLLLIENVSSALQYAHNKGVIHRDIKPCNIFVHDEGGAHYACLGDFGIARNMEEETASRSVATGGSQDYWPIEFFNGEHEKTPLTDLYSLGMSMYEILTGENAYDTSSQMSFYGSIINRPIAPPSMHDKRIPEHIDKICLKVIAKEKEKRYQTVDEFIRELRDSLEKMSKTNMTEKEKDVKEYNNDTECVQVENSNTSISKEEKLPSKITSEQFREIEEQVNIYFEENMLNNTSFDDTHKQSVIKKDIVAIEKNIMDIEKEIFHSGLIKWITFAGDGLLFYEYNRNQDGKQGYCVKKYLRKGEIKKAHLDRILCCIGCNSKNEFIYRHEFQKEVLLTYGDQGTIVMSRLNKNSNIFHRTDLRYNRNSGLYCVADEDTALIYLEDSLKRACLLSKEVVDLPFSEKLLKIANKGNGINSIDFFPRNINEDDYVIVTKADTHSMIGSTYGSKEEVNIFECIGKNTLKKIEVEDGSLKNAIKSGEYMYSCMYNTFYVKNDDKVEQHRFDWEKNIMETKQIDVAIRYFGRIVTKEVEDRLAYYVLENGNIIMKVDSQKIRTGKADKENIEYYYVDVKKSGWQKLRTFENCSLESATVNKLGTHLAVALRVYNKAYEHIIQIYRLHV